MVDAVRAQQKLVVRQWNSQRLGDVRGGVSEVVTRRQSEADALRLDVEARAREWMQTTWAEVEDDDIPETSAERPLPVQEERVPVTVGRVHHAYRRRAREEEAKKTQKAEDAARRHQQRLEALQTSGKSKMTAKENSSQRLSLAGLQFQDTAAASPECEPRLPVLDDTTLVLRDLEPRDVQENTAIREEVLRAIRHALSAGKAVRLLSTQPTSVVETKLMMQLLCTQSLLFCTRTQDVLPEHDTVRGIISLELLPRAAWNTGTFTNALKD
ncbi:hypothetical protein Poli38472_014088 [Pythium oligandrum]|uniref:Uncharacterized protein n=1 Tax=Pythium oligandrum TaxID=41045 RepID=A0A8K1CQD1_PYTOL|nr:hypothetical protein Poli38472_014088 [Pythium oligandrum]|eukprot:TMW66776.1 hypothetical protein Poli38472_014088 [Pythium oligandrum]